MPKALGDQAAVFKEPVLGGNSNNKYKNYFFKRTVDAENDVIICRVSWLTCCDSSYPDSQTLPLGLHYRSFRGKITR